ncbi:hypothetical protein N7513_009886 [Penicillium frequentans]|nr:hypothetical protein N7513_009886 [Penicillium glabrum]
MAELSLARKPRGSDYLRIWMGQPTRASDAMGSVHKEGRSSWDEKRIETPLLSAMKATFPSPCSGKAPFTWTNNEAGVHWSSEGKSHWQCQASPNATQIRGFLWPWTGSSWFNLVICYSSEPIPARGFVHPWQLSPPALL